VSHIYRDTRSGRSPKTEVAVPEEQIEPQAGSTPTATLVERRGFVRYRPLRPMLLMFLRRPSFKAGRALLRDISGQGICLVTTNSIPIGSVLFIQMRSRRKGNTFTRLSKVIHTTQQADGSWLIGARMTPQLSDAELKWVTQEADEAGHWYCPRRRNRI
jgi:hypothetical protein